MRSQRFLYFLPLLMLVGLMVFLGRGLTLDPRELPSVRIDKPLPSFKLPILGEKNQVKRHDKLQAPFVHNRLI